MLLMMFGKSITGFLSKDKNTLDLQLRKSYWQEIQLVVTW